MRNVSIKTAEKAAKANDNLNRRVERAATYDDFQATIPELLIVQNLVGTIAGSNDAQPLDPRHKVAVHKFPNGKFKTVPSLRTENYQELAHDHVFGTIHRILEEAGLGHKVLTSRFAKSSGELHADIVLDKAYKMDTNDEFEKAEGVFYTDEDGKNIGLYRPIIRVRSSFIQSSSVSMGVLRVLCSNLMVGVELGQISEPLSFSHVGDVVGKFNTKVEKLITGLFEGHIIENMVMQLQNDHLTMQAVIEWMLANIGKQATLASVDQFHLAEKEQTEMINKWIAYNMATWAMSNVVESIGRRDRAQRALSRLMAA